MLQILLNIPDSVAAKGSQYSWGYRVGAWLPFIVLAIIATAIIINKRKR